MADASRRDPPPADRPDSIPFPGACTPDGTMRWLCLTCGALQPILRPYCERCGEARDDATLGPWIVLATRTTQLMSPIAGRVDEPSAALRRFVASAKRSTESWADGEHYDLAALDAIDSSERPLVVALLADREPTWREADVLARVANAEMPDAIEALRASLRHHLSIDARLAAADALDSLGRLDQPLDAIVAREVRQLNEPRNGLDRALALARHVPTERVQQALLYASVNATTCAPPCARTLCAIRGVGDDPAVEAIVSKLGLHVSYFDRQSGFAALCEFVGLTLDP